MTDLGQCTNPACRHIRYTDLGDTINGHCVTCVQWAEDEMTALRAERDELRRMLDAVLALEEPVEKALRAEIADLKALYLALHDKAMAGYVEEVSTYKDKMACQESECQCLRELVASGAEEIAALKAENQKMHHDWMSEHAELELLRTERIENRKEEA